MAGYLEDPRAKWWPSATRWPGGRRGGRDLGGGPAYTDLDELLADPGIDAVEILTPTNLHYDHVLAALAAGKHVSCQKPLPTRSTEARAMAEAAEAAG